MRREKHDLLALRARGERGLEPGLLRHERGDLLLRAEPEERRLGDKAPIGVAIFYAVAVVLWCAAVWSVRPDWLALVALIPAAVHLANQALRADPKDGEGALKLFRSNRTAGFLVFLGMLVVGLSSR